MSEIYKNTSTTIHLDIQGDTADAKPTATAYKNGASTPLTVGGPTVVGSTEKWTTVVGFAQTATEGEVKVVWDFSINGDPVSKVDYLDVVTPYVTIAEVREELEVPTTISDEKIRWAERKVRRIIDNHCRQHFGLETSTKYVRGNGTKFISLPGRLVSSTSVTYSLYPTTDLTGYEVRNDGWSLLRVPDYTTPDDVYYTNPIYPPGVPSTLEFRAGTEYVINGTWGWERVPQPVKDSALLLIEQELCPQALYREKFVKVMTAADFRFEVFPEQMKGTGNVVADQLLADYVVDGFAIF